MIFSMLRLASRSVMRFISLSRFVRGKLQEDAETEISVSVEVNNSWVVEQCIHPLTSFSVEQNNSVIKWSLDSRWYRSPLTERKTHVEFFQFWGHIGANANRNTEICYLQSQINCGKVKKMKVVSANKNFFMKYSTLDMSQIHLRSTWRFWSGI